MNSTEPILYELKPYACMIIGAASVAIGNSFILSFAGITLWALGVLIWKMRKDYRKEN